MEKHEEGLRFRVYLVRQVLQGAVQRAADESALARMYAVWSLDHAVELLVRALDDHLGIRLKDGAPLSEMLNELLKARPALGSFLRSVENLRAQRNHVQHRGMIPSVENTRLACIETEAFIRNAVREVTGNDLDEMTLASQIENEHCRKRLEEASKALVAGDYRLAIRQAEAAFNMWPHLPDLYLPFSPLAFPLRSTANSAKMAMMVTRKSSDLPETAQPILRVLEQFVEEFASWLEADYCVAALQDMLFPYELTRFGVDLAMSFRFREVLGRVRTEEPRQFPDGPVLTEEVAKEDPEWNPTRNEATFAVDYVCDVLLKVEEWARRHPSGSRHEVAEILKRMAEWQPDSPPDGS